VLSCKLAGRGDSPTGIAEDEENIGGLAVDAEAIYLLGEPGRRAEHRRDHEGRVLSAGALGLR